VAEGAPVGMVVEVEGMGAEEMVEEDLAATVEMVEGWEETGVGWEETAGWAA